MTPLAVDRLVLATLKDINNRGAAEYNGGNTAAAFWLYRGALLVVRGLLEERLPLQKVVADGLTEVEQSPAEAGLKAYRLHEVIEHVRVEIKADYKRRKEAGPTSE